MSTPTAPSKRYYAAASVQAANWGTANATGANCGVLLLSDSGLARNQKFEPYPAIDQIIPKDGILGISEAPEFTPPVNLQYEAGPVGAWLAALYGTENSANNANAFTHTFSWANSVDEFFTYAEERPGHIWEVPSAIPFKASIKPDGAQIRAEITFRGNTLVDDSTVNNAAVMDAVTYVSRSTFLHLSHGEFRMQAVSENEALSANDAIEISDFEISIERALDNVHAVGSVNIVKPVEGDIPNATLKITLPRASNTNVDYFSTWEDMDPQMATLTFEGAAIGETGSNYAVEFYFPRLMLISPPDVKLDGVIKNELVFTMQEANAAPTGMNYARPYMKIINSESANYLA